MPNLFFSYFTKRQVYYSLTSPFLLTRLDRMEKRVKLRSLRLNKQSSAPLPSSVLTGHRIGIYVGDAPHRHGNTLSSNIPYPTSRCFQYQNEFVRIPFGIFIPPNGIYIRCDIASTLC
jgi:hypothetical protein